MTTENQQLYRAVPDTRLVWRHWAEDAERTEAEPLTLVYDLASDCTHLLNPLGVGILRMLQETPMTAAEVAEESGLSESQAWRFLMTLAGKGLVEELRPNNSRERNAAQ